MLIVVIAALLWLAIVALRFDVMSMGTLYRRLLSNRKDLLFLGTARGISANGLFGFTMALLLAAAALFTAGAIAELYIALT